MIQVIITEQDNGAETISLQDNGEVLDISERLDDIAAEINAIVFN